MVNGAGYAWSVNDRGQGLLRLEPGWCSYRATWQKIEREINAAGYQIDLHERFFAILEDCTYLTLTSIGPRPGSWPGADDMDMDVELTDGVVARHLDN